MNQPWIYMYSPSRSPLPPPFLPNPSGSSQCFWTVVLEKTLESPLDCKEIQTFHPKGNQSWIVSGRTDAEAETPILWPSDAKNWLIWKVSDAGKDWIWEGKGRTDGWIASPTQWTWDRVHSRSWRSTGWPGMLQSMGWQRFEHDWATELNEGNRTALFFSYIIIWHK